MEQRRPLEIAIVGMACVFPGAPDLEAFWDNVRAGRDAITAVLSTRWDPAFYDPAARSADRFYCRRGGFVDEPGELATALGLNYVFAASIKWDEGHYGLAVLSRWPLVGAERHRLSSTPEAEPRIVLDVTVCADGKPLHLLNLHADRRTASRALGFADLRRIAKDDFGRGLEAEGHAGMTKAGADDQMAACLDDVAMEKPLAEARRHDRGMAEKANLAVMEMPRKGQGDTIGDLGEDVGLMGHEDDRRVVTGRHCPHDLFGEDAGDTGHADEHGRLRVLDHVEQ